MRFIECNQVKQKFESYPMKVRHKMNHLRNILLQAAGEVEGLAELQETLKWGEPSYVTKNGSTIRMDWKDAKPNEYALYFHCQTKLIDTFKELYKDKFRFEGNRAIVFALHETIAEDELKHCLSIALNYHRVKNLPLLGA